MPEPIYRVRAADAVTAVTRLAADPAVIDAALFGRDIHVVIERSAESELGELLRRNELPPESASPISPSLEDADQHREVAHRRDHGTGHVIGAGEVHHRVGPRPHVSQRRLSPVRSASRRA